MGFKTSVAGIPQNWITSLGSHEATITGTGTTVIIPAPTAGKIRVANENFLSDVFLRSLLYITDGSVPTGTIDGHYVLAGNDLSPNFVAQGPAIRAAVGNGLIFLGAGETLAFNLTALNGGATTLYSKAVFRDFDATGVTLTKHLCTNTSPFTTQSAVPVGKVAIPLTPSTFGAAAEIGHIIIDNRDDISHNFTVRLKQGSVVLFESTGNNFNATTIDVFPLTESLSAGMSAEMLMEEGVSTIAPIVYAGYKLVDVA